MAVREIPTSDRWAPDEDFGRRSVHVVEYDRPAGDDEALTAQSIRVMHELATLDAQHPRIIELTAAALKGIDTQTATAKEIADAIFRAVKATVKYEHEEALHTPFADIAGTIYDQTLISPAAVLQMRTPEGDCVDFSMLVHAMARTVGLPCAYKTIAADPQSPNYSHVYAVLQIAPGEFYPMDASNAPGPGLEFDLPRGKKSRLWPNPVDLATPPMIRNKVHRLADLYEDAGIDAGYGGTQYGTYPDLMTGPSPSPASLPSSDGTDWTKVFATIANDATGIAAPLIRQANIKAPYYIQGANGAQILYDPSTGKTANAGSAAQRTPAVISQNILIGAGIAAAVLIALTAGGRK